MSQQEREQLLKGITELPEAEQNLVVGFAAGIVATAKLEAKTA